MRCLPPWALAPLAPLLVWAACDAGDAPATRGGAATTVAQEPPAGRVVVVRLGAGVELVGQRTLTRVAVARRPGRLRWRGRWEVRGVEGRTLHWGQFRVVRRRHALFGDTGGPAQAVDVPMARPVVWLRVPWPAGARTLVLYDDHGRTRLGEVAL